MPLVTKETQTGVPIDDQDSPLIGTPGSAAAQQVATAGEAVVPQQSRAERVSSFDADDFGVPNGREEDWRFTPVDRLGALLHGHAGTGSLDISTVLPSQVTEDVIDTRQARALGAPAPADRAAVLASTHSAGVRHFDIPAEAELDAPLRIDLTGAGQTDFSHLVLTAGRHSKATVVLRHRGQAQFGELVSVLAGDGADLTFVTLQEWADDALHLAQHDVVVGRDASVRHIAVTLGGRVTRVCTNAQYSGTGGSFEGFGVYFADAGQDLEHRLFVDHEPPRCTSNVEYKGALQGETAHTVWVGDVLIRATAEGTDTYELNRNLVLTEGARADSVPNLEIETGDIKGAGHASATGRFDDEQLFYLQARGIPEREARRLVVRGFFAEIIARIGVSDVVEHLMAAIDEELALSMGEVAEVATSAALRTVVEEATS